ncbi:ABC transporter ATP-binding protein/permease [Lachnospiraceae bacterium CLA-AA-H215]|uniref:ABC transporter ATP-binding protein/permease n=1 Tax=Hominifimenecus microfluidus TaxID=2885348 RepID=A0AAE3EBG7_9FIRM|nr:ABC transporter ATP-binding protein [Hominifimenecus microfluidus]MCC2231932.1 ABC transporter ATP-binding protein/permease [Hominifimenecus microfluidus]
MKRDGQVRDVIGNTIKEKKLLSGAIVCTVLGAVLVSLVPPLILAQIVDRLTAGKDVTAVLMLLYFGMLALTGLLESVREGLLIVFGQKITHALRSRLMKKFGRLTTDNVNRQEPGTLVSRFVGDVDTVEKLFTSGIISMFADACRIVSILVVIWFRNRGLSLILLLLLPVLFLFTRQIQKRMLAAQIENRRAVGRASAYVPETLHNIRTIHCLKKETYMEEKYDQYIGVSYQAMERTNFYDAVYSPVILILNAVVVAVVMLLSASGNGKILTLFGMSAGTAVAVLSYISQIFRPVESLGMEIQTIQSAIAGIHRINEFFALEEKKEHPKSTGVRATKEVPFVEFRDVTFGYEEHVVLEHMSFKVMDGEQATLSGRTGAGKSTILKLLLGLYEPLEGDVLIHGVPAVQIGEEERRRLFGYVEQSFHMVPGTVRDQITLFDERITESQIRKAAELTGLQDAIEGLEHGYDTICTPELFSQGQWQLLSIARATAAGPSLLLLDEITANLDADTEKTVLQALNRAAQNRTVISISHRTSAKMGKIIAL